MGGFPTRTNRTAMGPEMENEYRVTDPKRQLDADVVNMNWWQLAGLGQVAPLALFHCTVDGGVVTNALQALAFDPNGGLTAIAFTYEAVGVYSFAFASQYPDERGVNVSLVLQVGAAHQAGAKSSKYAGTHTGSDNQAALTDAAQSWTTDELVGKIIYNLTDGSTATITANTATTVTGTLSGGSEDDWDTDDAYVIHDPEANGIVVLTSDIAGYVVFTDDAGAPVDPSGFALVLW